MKGGIPLTDAFSNRTVVQPLRPGLIQTTQFGNGSRNFLLGPTIEFSFPFNLSVEADALYKPLDLKVQSSTLSLITFNVVSTSDIATWQFPILAKYRLPLGRVSPYVEAGPTFRAIASSPAENMFAIGVSAGVGLETSLGRLRIAPEVRYTHWGRDGSYISPYHAASYQDQVELLAGLSIRPCTLATTTTSRLGWRGHVSIGVKGGLPFANTFASNSYGAVLVVAYPSIRCGNFSPSPSCQTITDTLQPIRVPRDYLVGPFVDVHLPLHLSLESDALYGSLGLAAPTLPGLALGYPVISQRFDSWSFPVLAKYRFHAPFANPYLGLGPTFRWVSAPASQYLSKTGVATTLGVDAVTWKIHVSPEFRFIHWGPDARNAWPFYQSHRNQAQFLLGLSY